MENSRFKKIPCVKKKVFYINKKCWFSSVSAQEEIDPTTTKPARYEPLILALLRQREAK